ncbi:hypothetical protein R6Q57_029387 [Mikania cordata]
MDSTKNESTHDSNPFLRFYKNGKIQRPIGTPIVSPSDDPIAAVISKDVVISADPSISARLYRPTAGGKLPLIIYIHGGAFSIESAFSTLYHSHLNVLTATSRVVAVSIEYRLAPEHLVPICYEDCWEAIKWVGQTSDPWIKRHADLNRVFLAGDSAGANIAHNLAVRAGVEGPGLGLKIVGMALVHPYFEFEEPSKLWMYICPGSSGINDPRINPAANPGLLEKIVCGKVQVVVAGEDKYRARAWSYYETLKKSGWSGDVDIMETKEKGHTFHLTQPDCEEASKLVGLLASFFNQCGM